ncbi:MAG: type II toxin-antitoxin system VapC family toxin [Ahrensia sp.]|nr:type II toxin-antitoxin system VapC family toxin [Ahrensia sp.]
MTDALLLDTCCVLWLADDAEITAEAEKEIQEAFDQGSPVYISPITAWEVGLMSAKGRLKLPTEPQRWLEQFMRVGVQYCDMSARILIQSTTLPNCAGQDPADRIIIATAREYGYRIVTRDRNIVRYAKEGYVRAVVC